MPYLVSTKRPHESGRLSPTYTVMGEFVVSRVAVGTLEEATTKALEVTLPYALVVTPEKDKALQAACRALSESGGTVGPLPDGSLIEVERVAYNRLAADAGWTAPEDDRDYSSAHRHAEQVIAAFNEASR